MSITKNKNTKSSDFSTETGNSTGAQRSRILAHLRSGLSLTTLEARAMLDVLHPAARIMELRTNGWPIQTVWTEDLSPAGQVHRVARYILKKEELIDKKTEEANA